MVSNDVFMLYVLILYMSGGTYSLKPTLNDRFLWVTFHGIFYLLSEFLQEICWEEVAEEILLRVSFCWKCRTLALETWNLLRGSCERNITSCFVLLEMSDLDFGNLKSSEWKLWKKYYFVLRFVGDVGSGLWKSDILREEVAKEILLRVSFCWRCHTWALDRGLRET